MKPERLPATVGSPLALLLPLALGACRIPADTPVAENQFGEAGALATSSERRLVLYDRARGRVVAEPDRDAIQELAGAVQDAFRQALEATDPVDRADREERLAQLLEASLSDAPAQGGVALFRAGSWRLSEAYFNGVLEDADYAQLFELLFTRSAELVDLELRARGADPARVPGNATAAALPAPAALAPERTSATDEVARVVAPADAAPDMAPDMASDAAEAAGTVAPAEAAFRVEPAAVEDPARPSTDPGPAETGADGACGCGAAGEDDATAPAEGAAPDASDVPRSEPQPEPARCPACAHPRPPRSVRLRGRVV